MPITNPFLLSSLYTPTGIKERKASFDSITSTSSSSSTTLETATKTVLSDKKKATGLFQKYIE